MIANNTAMNMSWRNRRSNAQGQLFENQIMAACAHYEATRRAFIEKTPEPFRALKIEEGGKFQGRFTKHAQPDFKGTLFGGRAIVFEAKMTMQDRLKMSVLTQAQEQALNRHASLGAVAAVCIGIQYEFFFVPWKFWIARKRLGTKKSFTANDLQALKIKFDGAVRFLDYAGGSTVERDERELFRW